MSFNIERESDTKRIKTDIQGADGTDNVNIKREPFKRDIFESSPDKQEEPGMEFLVDDEEEEEEYEEEEENDDRGSVDDIFRNPESYEQHSGPVKSYEETQQEKSYYLSQLKRLEKKGNVISRKYTMEHTLDEIRGEVIRIKKEQDMDNSIDYLRQGLMFCVSTIEMADNKYDFGAQLGGWSQNVMGNIESYDGVFEELYDKYSNSVAVIPEIKLISMLAGSAFMFSLQKKISGQSSNSVTPKQREMSGPSIDTDELMRRLGEVDIDDDISSVSSSNTSVKITEEQPSVKTINVSKKRGRPSKK